MPLLGEYRSDDQIVISKHIDWAWCRCFPCFLDWLRGRRS